MFRVCAILASLSSAAHLDGACPAGQCPSVEQDETGMIQSKASLTHVRRHQHMKATPNNTADCKNSSIVPNTNPSIPMVYDDTCPGLGCFETYPCRYCRDDTKDMPACKERAALTQVKGTPNNTADCKNSSIVPNTNPSIPMVYDDTCPGLGCFETYPCRYCRDDTKDMPACKERAALTQVKGTPNNTADCKDSSIVPNTNPSIPMVYDDTCPGLGCFETYPCRYCRDDTKDVPACKERAVLTQVKGTPNNTADCKNSSIVPNTNPSIPMVYDDSCPGLGCFETYPCRYCRDDTKDMPACKERAALTTKKATPGTP